MKHHAIIPLLAAAATVAATAMERIDLSVKALPPSVVSTIPQCGDTAVDPNLKEIRVTFSKDMMTEKMWAICQVSKAHFPEAAGEIRYLPDKRTCVFPVKLQPGKTYVLWFNLAQFDSFRDTDNHPAVPYQLVFETRKESGTLPEP